MYTDPTLERYDDPEDDIPHDVALNSIAEMFREGEECEGQDGMIMCVSLDLWNEAFSAFLSILRNRPVGGEKP
jgi:hypothetical protein